tara:strand:+ start:5255 stop:5773 length:519 start_codon:yes stop_codon:yes gene_type:complete
MIKREHSSANGTKSFAIYSPSGKHRYLLNRTWNPSGKSLLYIGLNPSTATEISNDPTITRVINFAKREGFGSISICNLFSYRATLPSDLKSSSDPIGKETDPFILQQAKKADSILLGWGNHASFLERGKSVQNLLLPHKEKTFCLGLTKSNEPKHPLYLKSESPFIRLNLSQ